MYQPSLYILKVSCISVVCVLALCVCACVYVLALCVYICVSVVCVCWCCTRPAMPFKPLISLALFLYSSFSLRTVSFFQLQPTLQCLYTPSLSPSTSQNTNTTNTTHTTHLHKQNAGKKSRQGESAKDPTRNFVWRNRIQEQLCALWRVRKRYEWASVRVWALHKRKKKPLKKSRFDRW